MPASFDVAVVGAGPAGSAAAISLARRGYHVALIDKQGFPREKLCGDFVNPINWPIFRELGVEARILAQPHCRVTNFRITSPAGESAEISFSQSEQTRTYGLGLARARLDYILLQRAAEAGATIQTGRRLQRISKSACGWQLHTSAGEIWRAKVLIGADGRNSWVAQQLGINKRAAMEGRAVGFQMRLKPSARGGPFSGTASKLLDSQITSLNENRIEIHIFPGGYAGLVKVGDGIFTLGLAIEKRVLPRVGNKQFFLCDRLAQNPFLKTMLQTCKSTDELRSAYPVYFAKRRSFGDGILLVGDAARATEPVTGEGIYFAMRSGMLAAETLDQALRKGDLSSACLRSYEQECASVLRSRTRLNAFLRFAIYRPALIGPLIRWSARNNRLLGTLIDAVCVPAGAR